MKKKLLPLFFGLATMQFSYSQVVDQPNVAIGTTELVSSVDKNASFYQSFTSGISGQLTKLDLFLTASGNAVSLKLEVFEGSFEGGDLGATALGVQTITVPKGSSNVFSATFSNLVVVKGTKYSIKLSSTSTISVFVMGESASAYSAGNLSYFGVTDEIGDAYFKTYVKEDVTTGLFTNDSKNETFTVSPNPCVGDKVNFSKDLSSIKLFNSFGLEVVSVDKASSLDLSSLSSGTYTLLSNEGSSRIVLVK